MANVTKIIVETTVAAPIDAVWRAWNTPADIKQWNAASDDWHTTKSEVDLRVGGAFLSRMEAKDGSMGFDFAGTYTRVEKNRSIELEFGGRGVLVEFIPTANAVNVRQTFDAESTHPVEQQRHGWQSILNNFAKHVEAKQPPSQTTPVSAGARSSGGEELATAKNTICVWYDKDAEAAARFYAETFPDSAVRAVHLAPSDYPSGKRGDVLTVEFTVAGVSCLGLNGGPAFKHTAAFSFQIATDDQQETDRYWNAIVGNGGQENACGWCQDKWGISWQITPRVLTEALAAGGDQAKRAFETMMGMKKIDVAVIKAARRG